MKTELQRESVEELANDLKRIAAYLALDDFGGQAPNENFLAGVDLIALLGNQVVATLTATCELAARAPRARVLFSGGAGHSTGLLFENLRRSVYGPLVEQGLIEPQMAEAEMYAAVARQSFGIAEERLLVEKRSTNTSENARLSLALLAERELRPETILLLQDPLLQRRSVVTWSSQAELAGAAGRVWSYAIFVPRVEAGSESEVQFAQAGAETAWTMERFVGLTLGEIKRLSDDEHGYGPRGMKFLPHVEIPAEVMQSYRRVVATEWVRRAGR
jgi:hypothetical protein